MKPYRCPRCNTPVEIPEDRPGVLCTKCRSAVMWDEVERPRQSRPATLFLWATLITALLVVIGLWLYVAPPGPTMRARPSIGARGSRVNSTSPLAVSLPDNAGSGNGGQHPQVSQVVYRSPCSLGTFFRLPRVSNKSPLPIHPVLPLHI